MELTRFIRFDHKLRRAIAVPDGRPTCGATADQAAETGGTDIGQLVEVLGTAVDVAVLVRSRGTRPRFSGVAPGSRRAGAPQ